MAISLANLKSTRNDTPPRILVHGVPGVGKTSLACEFPDPVMIQMGEEPPHGVDVATFGDLSTYHEVMDAMGSLATEDHAFKTLIFDSLDGLEKDIIAETCRINGWKSIEEPGYGRGYKELDALWYQFIEGCSILRLQKGMTIVFIAHSSVTQFDDPGTGGYSRYDLRLDRRKKGGGAADIIASWVDYIFFINSKIATTEIDKGFGRKDQKVESSGMRFMFTDARPAFIAKNRSQTMPAQIPYKKGEGFKALAPHIFPAEYAAKAAGKAA